MKPRIPPLTAIRVFDVASRTLNFARAADELGVSQSAVSKQISTLESYVGAKLFERNSSGVSLTFEGRELKQAVGPAFKLMEYGFQRYSRGARYTNTIRLATVPSFAAQFLVPRLDAFEVEFPQHRLEILTSDRLVDLSRESIDVSVRFGAGDWPDVVSTRLFEGHLIPVCALKVYEANKGDTTAVYSSMRRIQAFLLNEWLQFDSSLPIEHQGPGDNIILEHFLVAIQAVASGQGIGMLPEILIRKLIDDGEFIQIGDARPWLESFYLCHLPNANESSKLGGFIDWLIRETEADIL